MEAGQFRAIIDRQYALAAIADAYRYVESGQKVGIVVINIAAPDESAHTAKASRAGTSAFAASFPSFGQPSQKPASSTSTARSAASIS